MSIVIFNRDKLVETDASRELPPTEVEPERILSKLRLVCEIEPDVTLGDIFKIVSTYPQLESFIAEYSWCWTIREWHAQATLPPTDNLRTQGLKYLEISRSVTTEEDILDQSLHFYGVGKAGEGMKDFGVEPGEDIHYGIVLTQMNDLAGVPIKLTTNTRFTLLDVLDAIYDEVSFHGGPRETAEVSERLDTMMEEINSGTAKLVPLDDIITDKIQ